VVNSGGFGLVVDETDQPVAGVVVSASLRSMR